MMQIAMSILHRKEDAEDAVQNSILAISRHMDKLGDIEDYRTKAYMQTVVRNAAIDLYRKNQKAGISYEELIVEPIDAFDLENIAAVRGIGVEDLRAVAIGEGVASRAGIIHGGHAEGVLVGAGGAAGGEVHIVQIQGTRAVNRVFRPAGGIACRDGDDGVGLGQLIQDALILRIRGGKARVAGAERQVHGVTAEHHGVFDGDHVVGIICTAALAEDLHRDELGIGGNALHEHGIERLFIAALAVGDIAVRRGDTGDVGAVLTLFVIIVRDVEVLVHIVERERELAGEIELARIGDKLADVQLRQNSGDLASARIFTNCANS